MNYYYRFNEVPEPVDTYYSAEEINRIPVYPETLELLAEWETDNNHSDLWPIYDIDKWSWEPVDCKDAAEARDYLGVLLNLSIYETIHDI